MNLLRSTDYSWISIPIIMLQDCRSALLLTFLPLLGLLTAAMPATALPAIVRAQPNHPNPPLCYIQMAGQTRQSLDQLCGVGSLAASSKLSLYGPDGKPSPALIAAVKRLQNQTRNMADPSAGAKALREFAAQLPLSPNAQSLMDQTASLIEQMSRPSTQNSAAAPKFSDPSVFEKLDVLNQQLKQDPSFIEVDKAVKQAMGSGS
jgi:hypothetical protein